MEEKVQKHDLLGTKEKIRGIYRKVNAPLRGVGEVDKGGKRGLWQIEYPGAWEGKLSAQITGWIVNQE